MSMRLLTATVLTVGLALFSGDVFAHDSAAAACDTPSILVKIQKRFHHQSHNVHNDRIRIEELQKVHEHRAEDRSEFSPVARRYCGATALLSNGHKRTVWYLIEKPAGFFGVGNNVEFCVSGFDRWNVYNGHCRILR